MKTIATLFLIAFSLNAFSSVDCTKEDTVKWQDQNAFKAAREAEGYKIKVFKVTKGNCYEIYGTNKEGKKIVA